LDSYTPSLLHEIQLTEDGTQGRSYVIHAEKSNKMQQCIKIYYSIFIRSSTCFGRHTAHHQEPKYALAASGFADEYVEGCWTCGCWTLSCRVYSAWQRPVTKQLLASGHEMEHLVPASKQSTNLYDIYLMLCAQSWTPDDGRKNRPKHV